MKRQKSILILEDEDDLGQILIELLEPLYEEVLYTPLPAQAIQLIQARPFSLIISDVHMPEMDGADFVRKVRSIGRIEPIVFLTGNSTKELILSAIRLGVADVIDKPFDVDELLVSIDRIFDIERRREQYFEDAFRQVATIENLEKQKRMIGLLKVATEKKKTETEN